MTPTRFLRPHDAAVHRGAPVSPEALALALSQGDPLADAAVEALAGWPREAQAAAIDALLARRSAHLPAALARLDASLDAVPAWLDREACDRGGEVILRAGMVSGLALAFKSLVLGYCSPAGNKPLMFSGRLEEDVPRRVGETARFVEAVCLPGGMRRGAEGFAATVKVRLIHARVRQALKRSPRWDESAWGLPINQYDMAGTVLLFSWVLLEGCQQLGFVTTAAERRDVMHLWRWVGTVMGVQPALLCTSVDEAAALWRLLEATQGPPDEDSRRLAFALITSPRAQGGPAWTASVGFALSRQLLGDRLAAQLGYPRSAWDVTPAMLRRVVRRLSQAQHLVPLARQVALGTGTRYWRRSVELRVGQERLPFVLPAALRGRPVSPA